MEFAVHVAIFALLEILLSCHVSSQWIDDVDPFKLWPEGEPIPYEISNQYSRSIPSGRYQSFFYLLTFYFNTDKDESLLIKAALVEIMKSTPIKFVPRTKKEEDYIVFVEFKALSQTRGFVSK